MNAKMKKRLKKIGRRFKAARVLRGLSQDQLANKSKISQGLISKIEKHGQIRSIEDAWNLLEALNVSPNRILKGIK